MRRLKGSDSATCILTALLLGLVGGGCPSPPPADTTGSSTPQDTGWITIYQPDRAWNGYTLAFYAHRVPILLDMNGRIVHRWPQARVKSRIRLLENGSLLGIALGRGVVEYDWDGNLLWQYEPENGFAHHDVIRLPSGNTMTLVRPDRGRFDNILEVDPKGAIAWEWHSGDHLEPFVLPEVSSKNDVTHLNSIQELPANPWFDGGDQRFRPGNLLVSAREMNLIFVLDKETQEVVWTFDTDLDKQHEPLMIDPGFPNAGNILVFNNRYRSFYTDRRSSVLEIEPSTGAIVWQYRSAGFYSPTSGLEQPLPNGNILITSSRGGRTFEITPAGRVVWEWAPRFDTTRSRRYSYDYSPQLAAMSLPQEIAVTPERSYRHIDTDTFRFARRGLRRDLRLNGERMSVLRYNNDCRNMVLPLGARVAVAFGLDTAEVARRDRDRYAARFSMDVSPVGAEEAVRVLDEVVDSTAPAWRTESLDLSAFALRRVSLCIATQEVGAPDATPTEGVAVWQQPIIEAFRPGAADGGEDILSSEELTPEELRTRQKHLEALGYIN